LGEDTTRTGSRKEDRSPDFGVWISEFGLVISDFGIEFGFVTFGSGEVRVPMLELDF